MGWPSLPYADWAPTKQTLHRYAQMVGKVRMALVPFRNHWWHVTLSVSARGLTTGPMPFGDETAEVELDFVDHRLRVRASNGREAGFALRERPACAHFYEDLFTALREVGVSVEIRPEPFDLGDSPAFPDDLVHDSYDADAVARFWTILRLVDATLARFRTGFVGKASPSHLFWHGFDLAHARYSGRRAPPIPGADAVTAEAYSHEVIAFGWWPGDDRLTPFPAFYSYTAPEPEGLRDLPLAPAGAEWQDTGRGSLAVLPYDDVRAAPIRPRRCSRSTRARTGRGSRRPAGTPRRSRAGGDGRARGLTPRDVGAVPVRSRRRASPTLHTVAGSLVRCPNHRHITPSSATSARCSRTPACRPPDAVEHEPDAVTFYWHGPRVAVVVERGDRRAGTSRARAERSTRADAAAATAVTARPRGCGRRA